jgi:hypothetical protein
VTTKTEVITAAGPLAAHAWAETSALGAEAGPEAVADAAWEPGGPDREQIAAKYEGWVAEEIAKRDGASAA